MLSQARRRLFTTSTSPLVAIEHHIGRDHPTATLTLNGPPVNSLSLEMLSALRNAIVEVDASPSRGFVLASSHPTIFSAGLDIQELHNPDETRLRDFWTTLQDTFLALYGSSCASVAAIDGHAPAGGCLLASACDERVMASGKFGIGLNETKLGITAPFWFADALEPLIGQRRLERMLQLGSLLTPAEALEAGLVDALADHGGKRGADGDEGGQASPVLTRAHEILEGYVAVNHEARHASKLLVRSAALERLRTRKQEDLDAFLAYCLSPGYQATIGAYLEGLKGRKKGG